VIVVLGPAAADTARKSAGGVASASGHVLNRPGSTIEVRSAGSFEPVAFESGAPSKAVAEAVQNATTAAAGATPDVVMTTLDAAAQVLSRRPGSRLLVAIVENQPLSSDAGQSLTQLIAYCQEHAVRVLVVDQSQAKSKETPVPLRNLAEDTGGAYTKNPRAIDTQLTSLSALPSHGQQPPAAPAQNASIANLPPMPADLPVSVRFLRTNTMRAMSYGVARSHSSYGGPGGGGIRTQEGGSNVEGVAGPTRGVLLVEAPMSRLHFQVDDHLGTYFGKARITQIAREASGREVWRASKDVVVKGPLDKLKSRQSGNLYYMRDVTLPGGNYVVEGIVEDLIAQKSGGVREPLMTSQGLPGFNVSDAVFVRGFKSSTDRFEADSVMSYDGEALSPLLNPVFEGNKPVTLQVYFTIYPDLQGGQPELSLELLHAGRVVGRIPIPFTDKLKDSAREGRGSISGEQKNQFPFLATIRGAKLTPGDYEARVIVRQDRNALSRNVRFRVDGEVAQAGLIVRSPAAGDAPPAPPEEDLSGIVIPEIDPVDLKTDGPSLPAGELARYWEESALRARDFSDRLPNFRCLQETRRLSTSVKNPEGFKERDVYIDELTYENGEESYRTIEVNGLKTDRMRRPVQGVKSRGEFGTMMRGIFSKNVAAKYKWAGRAMAGGTLCRVFEIEVPAERSNFVLAHNTEQEIAGYKGRIFIDEESGLVRRISIQGDGLPPKFGLQSPSMSLDYGLVKIGELDYLLPLRSVLQTRQGKSLIRNETVFRDYHKFEASSSIQFQTPDSQ
jgi:hypothetical protein